MVTLERTRKPLIKSQLVAEREARAWTEKNTEAPIVDGDGMEWTMTVVERELLNPANPRTLLNEFRFSLQLMLNASNLVSYKIFDAAIDARIIALLGEAEIPLILHPEGVRAPEKKDARSKLQRKVDQYREFMKNRVLKETKRRTVGTWIDRDRCFL